MHFRVLTLVALAGLSACGSPHSATTGFTPDDVVTPSFSGDTGQIAIATGGSVKIINRIDPAKGNLFHADIVQGAIQTTAPTRGTAQMTGPFIVRQASNLHKTGGIQGGTLTNHTGQITLTADFAGGTLKGVGEGLAIDGKIAEGELTGDARFGGVAADLMGFIGGTNAIGAFAGKTATSSIAGGFAVAQ